jgi:predicted membrane protein
MNGRYIFGIVLIALGLIFFLCQFFDCSAGYLIGTFWPLIIIGVGLNHIIKSKHSLFNGVALLVIGILLQMSRLDILPWGFWGTLWPVALILIGLYLLLNKNSKKKNSFGMNNIESSADYVDSNALFSGNKERVITKNFKGGAVSAYFGGVELDLRNAEISPEGAYLETNAAFGGVEIFVPYNCKVRVSGTPFLGGIDNKTHYADVADDAPVLHVNAFVAFGGIDIRN